MELGLVYDPRGHTFESWSALMIEAYAEQQLQMGLTENKWQEFAQGMLLMDVFNNDAMPQPSAFSNWKDWAQEVVNVVNAPAQPLVL